jgi:hypothetical protein
VASEGNREKAAAEEGTTNMMGARGGKWMGAMGLRRALSQSTPVATSLAAGIRIRIPTDRIACPISLIGMAYLYLPSPSPFHPPPLSPHRILVPATLDNDILHCAGLMTHIGWKISLLGVFMYGGYFQKFVK